MMNALSSFLSLYDSRTELERGRDCAEKAKDMLENYGDQEGAIIEYEHAMPLLHGPEFGVARLELVILYARTEKYEKAQSLFKQIGDLLWANFWADVCMILLALETSTKSLSLAMCSRDGAVLQEIFNAQNPDRFVDFVKEWELERGLTDWQTTLLLRVKSQLLMNIRRDLTSE